MKEVELSPMGKWYKQCHEHNKKIKEIIMQENEKVEDRDYLTPISNISPDKITLSPGVLANEIQLTFEVMSDDTHDQNKSNCKENFAEAVQINRRPVLVQENEVQTILLKQVDALEKKLMVLRQLIIDSRRKSIGHEQLFGMFFNMKTIQKTLDREMIDLSKN